ncbi:MAG TPA: NUDIX domain-containing protein [Verrucomicrobiae bacterium]|nr:NUDIX domain-containing protein [Verrucomicrobiae bacterium]
MHPYQRHIVDLLLQQSPRRYAELKPVDVEGNIFSHHLKKLIKEELVAQLSPGSYALGKAGRKLAGNVSATTGEIRSQQKILVEIALQNEQGEWLLFERGREPYRGLIGFPAGRRHAGETLLEAATRDITEKAGITPELRFAGTLSFTIHQEHELYNFVETHIFAGKTTKPNFEEGLLGTPMWMDLGNKDLNAKPFFPGLAEVYQHIISTEKPSFCEYHIEVNADFSEYQSKLIPL